MSTAVVQLDPVVRLSRDIKTAVKTLSVPEARFLVDCYYQQQANRIAAANQVRAMTESEEPHEVLRWLAVQSETLENQVKRALDRWTDEQPLGVWMKSITGIGPVLTAGLLAHIDITKAETAGAIWSFAGLSNAKWEKGQKRPWNASLKVLCVKPDCVITTKNGHIPIQDVRVGDEVLTHRGRFRKVTQTFESDYDGVLVGAKLYGAGGPSAWLTGSHPVYAMKQRTYPRTRRNPDGSVRTGWVVDNPTAMKIPDSDVESIRAMRNQGATLAEIASTYGISQAGVSIIARSLTRKHKQFSCDVGWLAAGSIQAGWMGFVPVREFGHQDIVLKPKMDGMIVEDNSVLAEGRWAGVPHPKTKPFPLAIPVDERVARFVGLYLAERHVSGRACGLSFHEKETEYHEFVEEILSKVFYLRTSRVHNAIGRSMQVIISSKAMASILTDFGIGSHYKHLPACWMDARPNILAAVVRGLFEGDAKLRDNEAALTSVSEELARQVTDILRMFGVSCSLNHHLNVWKVTVNDVAGFYSVIMGRPVEDVRTNSHCKQLTPEGAWYRFRPPTGMPYTGKVYNLEVEDDHSYVVEGIAVHNCWKIGQSFVKVSTNKNDTYGKLYVDRKLYEQAKNEKGEFADQAAAILKIKKIGKETPTYAAYAEGRLPPSHIQQRAERYATKQFLADFHTVAYFLHWGTMPPLPYVFAHKTGHVHYRTLPNAELIPGLPEALEETIAKIRHQ